MITWPLYETMKEVQLHSFPSQSCRKKEVWKGLLFCKHKFLIKMSFQEWIKHQLCEWLKSNNFLEYIRIFQAEFLDLFHAVTVLSHFLAHVPISEHAPLLEYRCTEVNCNIYNIGVPTFLINSQNMVFQLLEHAPKSAIIRYGRVKYIHC